MKKKVWLALGLLTLGLAPLAYRAYRKAYKFHFDSHMSERWLKALEEDHNDGFD